jgi:hypothetical protein
MVFQFSLLDSVLEILSKMKIPITRDFDALRIVGFMEIHETFATELIELTKLGVDFRLGLALVKKQDDQYSLMEVSIIPKITSET